MGEVADKEYQFVGESGYETPWRPLPKDGVKLARGKEREKLGRTYGLAIRETAAQKAGG